MKILKFNLILLSIAVCYVSFSSAEDSTAAPQTSAEPSSMTSIVATSHQSSVAVSQANSTAAYLTTATRPASSKLAWNHFALRLFSQLSNEKRDENLFISPFSISTALAMCYAGARNDTAHQIRKLLDMTEMREEEILGAIDEHLANLDKAAANVSLSLANKIYASSEFNVSHRFNETLAKHFDTELESIDFGKSEMAAKRVNEWVSQRTNGHISDLVTADMFSELTKLMLVNAIYFKGNWSNKFDASNTYKEDFHLANGSVVQVDMMKMMNKKFKYQTSPGGIKANTCEFPYAGNSLAMTIVLPNEGVRLEEVESQLNELTVKDVLRNEVIATKVNVYVPKFKLETKAQLSDKLKQLGLNLPFDATRANFSGIGDSKNDERLYVSSVIHQANIDVNEEGAEAAAATGISFAFKMSLNFPIIKEFKCDKPFLFIIHEKKYNDILFYGKFVRPI